MAIAPSCVVPRSSQAPSSRLLIFVPVRASSSLDLSRKAKPLSSASTTSTGATSVSSRNSRPSELTSSAFPAPHPRAARARLSANCSSLPGNLCNSFQQAARRVIDIQRRGQDTVADSPKHGRDRSSPHLRECPCQHDPPGGPGKTAHTRHGRECEKGCQLSHTGRGSAPPCSSAFLPGRFLRTLLQSRNCLVGVRTAG